MSMCASSASSDLHPVIAQFRAGNYEGVIHQCEAAIAAENLDLPYFWYGGMALLLNGQEEEAHSLWVDALMGIEDESDALPNLLDALHREVQEARSRNQVYPAWRLLQVCLDFTPEDVDTVLDVLELGLQVEENAAPSPGERVAGIVDHLVAIAQSSEGASEDLPPEQPDANLVWTPEQGDRLIHLCMQLLDLAPAHPTAIHLTAFCIHHGFLEGTQRPTFAAHLYETARACYARSQFAPAIAYVDWSVQLDDTVVDRIRNAIAILREGGAPARPRALELTEHWRAIAPDQVSQLQALETYLTLLADAAGQDDAVSRAYQEYRILFQAIATESQETMRASPDPLPALLERIGPIRQLVNAGSLPLYFEDEPVQYRPHRNAIAQAAQLHLEALLPDVSKRRLPSTILGANRPLKVGYFASTLYRHSVGWLSRWLFKYHSRDRLEVHLYSTTESGDFVQNALKAEYGERFHAVPTDIGAIANQIADDGIDILVELDSLTSLGNSSVMALKPAPIQVNWLGFDGSGLPAIDYYIADPYVLPEDADTYYRERIWRLPHTYIAVDGFEVHTPTLQRSDLDIPADAIVYLSSQAGLKRNRHNLRVQLEVVKAVPHSYLLVKSLGTEPELLRAFMYGLAEDVGVVGDRLRFLPDVPSEFNHRANLNLADVVLDTYPYNGATTTLEALWVGLPIVTRVGQQFAARNSYTMLRNVGMTAGIAWSDEEYIDWGIRLGQDEALRREVAWQLHRSRRTAPLWNARRFAADMEVAFEQMWREQGEARSA